MNTIQAFFRKYNATPTTGAGRGWGELTTPALQDWLASYEKMVAEGKNASGQPLSAGDVRAINEQADKMRAELRRRGV